MTTVLIILLVILAIYALIQRSQNRHNIRRRDEALEELWQTALSSHASPHYIMRPNPGGHVSVWRQTSPQAMDICIKIFKDADEDFNILCAQELIDKLNEK